MANKPAILREDLTDGDRKLGTFLMYGFLLFNYVRPQEYIPGLHLIPLSGILSLLLIIWGVLHIRTSYFSSPMIIIMLLPITFLLSGIDAVNVSAFKLATKFTTQIFPQCLAIYILVNNKDRITYFMNWWCYIYLAMALITIANGGRGPGDFTNDENDAALALTMGIPFVFYSIFYACESKLQTRIRLLTIFILIIAIIITDSRGGFLGLLATLLVMWWFSKKRLKYAIITLSSAAIFGGIVTAMLPTGYIGDIKSISNPEDDTRVERIETWEVAWEMFKDNPILGVGAANFAWNAARYQRETSWWHKGAKSFAGRQTHSLYFQVLADLGIIGSLIYLYIIIGLPLKLLSARNKIPKSDGRYFASLLCKTAISSMAAFAVAGAFLSVAYYPHIPMWITIYAIILRHMKIFQTREHSTPETLPDV